MFPDVCVSDIRFGVFRGIVCLSASISGFTRLCHIVLGRTLGFIIRFIVSFLIRLLFGIFLLIDSDFQLQPAALCHLCVGKRRGNFYFRCIRRLGFFQTQDCFIRSLVCFRNLRSILLPHGFQRLCGFVFLMNLQAEPVSFAVLFFFRSLFIRVSCHLIQESACQDCSRCAEIGVWVFLRSFSFVWFGTKYKLIRTAVQNSILVRRLRFRGRNRFVRKIRIDGFIWKIREIRKVGIFREIRLHRIQRRIRYRFCLFQLFQFFFTLLDFQLCLCKL